MRKILVLLMLLLVSCSTVNAAKIPTEVKNYITVNIPQADIRFDGVIILPDNTVYLPLYPSLFSDIKTLKIKTTYPANKTIKQQPDIIIFNNDFVLMKVLSDGQGHKTVLHQSNPPLQVRTGLLPQDMLVPSGLIIPENIKGIIGNLKIDTKNEDLIKVENSDSFEEFLAKEEPETTQQLISQLKNKMVYITTNYSKNIQVLKPASAVPLYSLAQKSIPIDVKAVKNGQFLLVTSYERPFVDVISVADARFIKQINLTSNPTEILIDNENQKAYVTSPTASAIFVIDLNTMSLVQKITVNGYCEKLILAEDKMFYVDKMKNEIWAVELDNGYELKDIGHFPNVSALAFSNGKLYMSSRTKSRVAVIDYSTLGLINEFTTVNKPVSLVMNGNYLYILGAQNNIIQKFDTVLDSVVGTIELPAGGFSAGMHKFDNSSLVVVNDVKNNRYSIVDLYKGKLIKTYSVNVPLKDVIITDEVKLFE